MIAHVAGPSGSSFVGHCGQLMSYPTLPPGGTALGAASGRTTPSAAAFIVKSPGPLTTATSNSPAQETRRKNATPGTVNHAHIPGSSHTPRVGATFGQDLEIPPPGPPEKPPETRHSPDTAYHHQEWAPAAR